MVRRNHLKKFYRLMDKLERKVGGRGALEDTAENWPQREIKGVYFFFEDGERRTGSGKGCRVVRVGSHALKQGERRSLRDRLKQHRGNDFPTNNRARGSQFRADVGNAVCRRRPNLGPKDWPKDACRGDIRRIEGLINKRMWRRMRFLYLPVNNRRDRAYLERNAIALLSEYCRKKPVDPASEDWLGRYCKKEKVRKSGLWQSQHVRNGYEPKFLDKLRKYVDSIE